MNLPVHHQRIAPGTPLQSKAAQVLDVDVFAGIFGAACLASTALQVWIQAKTAESVRQGTVDTQIAR